MLFEYGVSGKWLELLKEIVPGLMRAAVIRDPAITGGIGQFAAIQSIAPSVGLVPVEDNLVASSVHEFRQPGRCRIDCNSIDNQVAFFAPCVKRHGNQK